MQEIYLVRHGSVENPQGIEYRREPGFGLSERGIREVRETARFLAGRAVQALYHSPLERCAQTASIIAEGLRVPMIESREINEWDRDESIRDVQARMNTFWIMLHAQEFEKVALISHRDPLRALLLGLAGGKLSEVFNPEVFPLKPGAVYLLKPGPDETSFENIFTPTVDI